MLVEAYLLARVVLARLAMQTKKCAQVELGGLEELNLAHVDLASVSASLHHAVLTTYVLERVDALSSLLNLAADNLGDELLGQLGERASAGLARHDLNHLLANSPDLRRCSIGCLLNLVGSSLGEGNGEEAEEVVIGGLDDNVGLDEGLPLADE